MKLKVLVLCQLGIRKLSYYLILVFGMGLLFSKLAVGQSCYEFKDVIYANIDGKDLAMDIYLPSGVKNPGLLVWVHGGAWRYGTKASFPKVFVQQGIAVASLDFRQSTEAPFPAAIHDIKAAIRFIRANASEYGLWSDQIIIAGESSGGHLAALVGVSNGNKYLEGEVGKNLNYSSDVQGIIDYYGASNLNTILSQSTPHGLSVREPALELLLGGLNQKNVNLKDIASPVFHVDKNDPPLLIIHGDQDNQMPINQSHELVGKYLKEDLEVYFLVVYGGGHGGDIYFSGEHLDMALGFVDRIVRK